MVDAKINNNGGKNYAVSFNETPVGGNVSSVKSPVNNTTNSANTIDNNAIEIERALNRSFANIKTTVNDSMYASGRHNAVVEEICLSADYDESELNQNIDILTTLLPKVRGFNKNLANLFVFEGIIDFEYASGKTQNTSLRIGRIR